jgi:hypothetical protein
MAYGTHSSYTPLAVATHYWNRGWNRWKTAYDQAVNHYYNQQIELAPEQEARQYWHRLKHPQSGINTQEVTDAMLSRFMETLLKQGISKFAVDCFILELRRLRRTEQ